MFRRSFIVLALCFVMVFSAPFEDPDSNAALSDETAEYGAPPEGAGPDETPSEGTLPGGNPSDGGSTDTESGSDVILHDPMQDKVDYEELGGGMEGDMKFFNGFNPARAAMMRGVARAGPHRWPNNVVPYDMSTITTQSHRNLITQAMNTLAYAVGTPIPGQANRRACVYFRPKTSSDRNYIRIVYGGGCSANVGFTSGQQMTLTLANPGCFYSGIIQHELLHVLGFYHEQSRPDRDTYITVNYANIQSGKTHNFNKYAWGSQVLNQNTAYDTGSIMHYGAYSFSSNGKPTIVPKKAGVPLGQRDRLSAIDIAEVRAYYSCR